VKTIITFFEQTPPKALYPLTLTRPSFDLRLGIDTLGEKWLMELHSEQTPAGTLRPEHQGLFKSPEPSQASARFLWIDPCFLPSPKLATAVSKLSFNSWLMVNGRAIAVCLDAEQHLKQLELKSGFWAQNESNIHWEELKSTGSTLHPASPVRSASPVLIEHVWDLLTHNGTQILEDLRRRGSGETAPHNSASHDSAPHEATEQKNPQDKVRSQSNLQRIDPDADTSTRNHYMHVGAHPLFIEEGAVVEPGVTFITESGPVYLGKKSRVMAGSLIRGPVAIGASATVKMGAKIYENTSIGPVCKVGGEISGSIFHSYSNKGHDGFVGDSLIGQWCNLGADTNTSNLKNNYGTVKVTHPLTGEKTDTGKQFLGTIMGDHTKTGINAMLNTGTVCGVSCNLIAGSYHPVSVPSFRWVTDRESVGYRFEKAAETMERVMARRNVELTDAYLGMMRVIFDREQHLD